MFYKNNHISATPKAKLFRRSSKKAKGISMRASVRLGIEIVVPVAAREKDVKKAIEKNKLWVAKQLTRIDKERALLRPNFVFLRASAEHHSITYSESGTVKSLLIPSNSELKILENSDYDLFKPSELLQEWLHRKARSHLSALISVHATKIGKSYSKLRIARQRTLWGSCSSKRTISLNRNLMFFSPVVVNYVLIHELMHLDVMGHSEKFWKLVEKELPDTDLIRSRLRYEADNSVPSWAWV